NQHLEDRQSAIPMLSYAEDASAGEDPLSFAQRAERAILGAIFVAERRIIQEVHDGVDSMLRKLFRPARSDSFDVLDWRIELQKPASRLYLRGRHGRHYARLKAEPIHRDVAKPRRNTKDPGFALLYISRNAIEYQTDPGGCPPSAASIGEWLRR